MPNISANIGVSCGTVSDEHTSIYPVAGLSSTGVAFGVWLQNLMSGSGVATGTLDTTSSASWSLLGSLPIGSATSSFNNNLYGYRTGQIDIAVSPAGNVLAAWVAGSSLWYSTRSVTGGWSTPVQLALQPSAGPINVVNNDAGNGAIAYCTSAGAQVVIYSSSLNTMQPPKQISTQCVGYNGHHISVCKTPARSTLQLIT